MRVLAIDIGNTNIVCAAFENGEVKASWRIETQENFTLELEGYSTVVCSAVVPWAAERIRELTSQKQIPLIEANAQTIGLKIDLSEPDKVGADRITNALAVVKEHMTPAIVVDFGTATTFDVIDGQGTYCGGAIAPGLHLSLKALREGVAAKFPNIEIEQCNPVGKNTAEAMQSGMYWGYVGLVNGIIEQITADLGQKPYVIATGGLAHVFKPSLPVVNKVDEHLTLRGLWHLYEAQKNNLNRAA